MWKKKKLEEMMKGILFLILWKTKIFFSVVTKKNNGLFKKIEYFVLFNKNQINQNDIF